MIPTTSNPNIVSDAFLGIVSSVGAGDKLQLLEMVKGYAFKAAQINANVFSIIPWALYEVPREDRGELAPAAIDSVVERKTRRISEHRFISVLNQPFNLFPSQFWHKLSMYWDVWGELYIYYDEDGIILLPSHMTYPVASGADIVEFRVGYGFNISIPVENVCYIRNTNLGLKSYDYTGLIRGYSVFQAMLEALNLESAVRTFDQRWVNRGGMPQYAIMSHRPWTEDQKRDVRNQLKQLVYDPDNAGVGLILDDGQDIKQLGEDRSGRGILASGIPRDMRATLVTEIFTMLGVPPVWGLSGEAVSGGNAEASSFWHLTRTIAPFCRIINDAINSTLVPFYCENMLDRKYVFAFDNPVMTISQTSVSDYETLLKNGIMSRQEIRNELNLEGDLPLTNDDIQTAMSVVEKLRSRIITRNAATVLLRRLGFNDREIGDLLA